MVRGRDGQTRPIEEAVAELVVRVGVLPAALEVDGIEGVLDPERHVPRIVGPVTEAEKPNSSQASAVASGKLSGPPNASER